MLGESCVTSDECEAGLTCQFFGCYVPPKEEGEECEGGGGVVESEDSDIYKE